MKVLIGIPYSNRYWEGGHTWAIYVKSWRINAKLTNSQSDRITRLTKNRLVNEGLWPLICVTLWIVMWCAKSLSVGDEDTLESTLNISRHTHFNWKKTPTTHGFWPPPPSFFWWLVFFPLSKPKTHWNPFLKPYFRGELYVKGGGFDQPSQSKDSTTNWPGHTKGVIQGGRDELLTNVGKKGTKNAMSFKGVWKIGDIFG